jgi:hypothetical protein
MEKFDIISSTILAFYLFGGHRCSHSSTHSFFVWSATSLEKVSEQQQLWLAIAVEHSQIISMLCKGGC